MTVIHPETKMGPVSLTVANLDRSLRLFRHGLGLSVYSQVNGRVYLTANRSASPLLELVEYTGARPRPAYSTGLFHLALMEQYGRAWAVPDPSDNRVLLRSGQV